MADSIIFWVFAVAAVGSALGVVLHRSIIYAALFLIVVFLSNAAFFVLNNADFLAIAQMLVYAVGLTIIILFAIMFTGDKPLPKEEKPVSGRAKLLSGIVMAYVAILLIQAVNYPFTMRGLAAVAQSGTTQTTQMIQEGSTRLLGQTLFQIYGLPFELASILLLVAMIGAILLSKKGFKESELGSVRYSVDLSSHPTKEALVARQAHLTTETDPLEEIGGVKNPAHIS